MELFAKGAESNIYIDGKTLIKERIKKDYRIKEIDEKIRIKRTKEEIKILNKLKNFVNVPKIINIDEKNFKFSIEYIQGTLLRDINKNDEKCIEYGIKLGREIGKIHKMNVVHNDLTTSNVIIKGNVVYIIDFGLSFFSERIEDKAMDLIVLKHSLIVTKLEFIFDYVLKGYSEVNENFNKIFERMKKIEKRVRYFSE